VLRPFQEWRFLQLAVCMALWMLVSPLIERRWLVLLLLQAMLLNSLLVTLWANPGQRAVRNAVLGFWVISLLASALALLPVPLELLGASRMAALMANVPVLMACAVGFLMFVFRSRRLTADGIFATVTSYLLIAFSFAQVYLLVLGWVPDSFQLPIPADQRTPQALQGDMIYFSLITLATVGYGDILPTTDLTRTLAVIEAVIGQFYVAVIVAVFVGMYASQRRSPADGGV